MITLQEVGKSYDGGRSFVVRGMSLEIAAGETLVLLGASGCGKTTTLKMINRLIQPTEGAIVVDGEDVTHADPIRLRRMIGYAIQSIGLFPHMTIEENISVVPRLLKWDKARIDERIDHLLEMVGLGDGGFRRRFPNQLSGGQKQRIGVARALAADPPIVLMDEPFGALDPITREQLQDEFLDLESEIQKTVVFVTHDIFEAVRMGDRIALLNEGRIEQLAAPADLVEHPASEFVDQFLGQHRFQLSLLTKTVRTIMSADDIGAQRPAERPEQFLPARRSLVAALDFFKRTGLTEVPVYRRREFLGTLSKKRLVDEMATVLGETGSNAS